MDMHKNTHEYTADMFVCFHIYTLLMCMAYTFTFLVYTSMYLCASAVLVCMFVHLCAHKHTTASVFVYTYMQRHMDTHTHHALSFPLYW